MTIDAGRAPNRAGGPPDGHWAWTQEAARG